MSSVRRGAAPAARDLAARKRRQAVWLRERFHFTLEKIAASGLPCVRHAPYRVEPECSECDPSPMYPSGRSAARKALNSALENAYPLDAEHRDELRRDALLTVDLGIERMKRDLVDPDLDPIDRARAATAIVRLLERMAKMTGTDAPARVQVTEELDATIDEELALLIQQAGGQA